MELSQLMVIFLPRLPNKPLHREMETRTVRQTSPHNLDRPPTAYRNWNEEIGVKILNGELSLNEAADYQFDVGVYLDN
ncbi:hypothetical protein AB3Y13_01555 [Vibrio alginolyticus]